MRAKLITILQLEQNNAIEGEGERLHHMTKTAGPSTEMTSGKHPQQATTGVFCHSF